MRTYILSILAITIVFAITSCEKTVEFTETTTETETNDTVPNPGHAKVKSRGVITEFLGYGGIQEDNILIEETTPTGWSRVSSWFGVTLILGENFTYDLNSGEFTFEQDGHIAYHICMGDQSDPIDTTLSLEVGKSYPADLIQMKASSMEELDQIMDSGDWIGGGVEVVELIVEEITDEYFKGTFQGSYPLNGSNEMVDISGEFNVVNVK